MRKIIKRILKIAVIAIIAIFLISKVSRIWRMKHGKIANDVKVVPTMNDEIQGDSIWCGSFQLAWNEFKDNFVKEDIIFDPQLDMVNNLNKGDFNKSMLSEHYYKNVCERNGDEYSIKTNLETNFNFRTKFKKLRKGKFGNKSNRVKYFGYKKDAKELEKDQIEVLYYYKPDDFAVKIKTRTDDEMFLCRNPEGKTFNEIYENMIKKMRYRDPESYTVDDEIKIPYMNFKIKKEYNEIKGKRFKVASSNNEVGKIKESLQSINFFLDEKGGFLRSEVALIGTMGADAMINRYRYFYFDDTFALFLQERGKEKPYFAVRIEDITKFQ